EAFPCGSRSITTTRLPCNASATARFTVVVVFPTPPFWLATQMIRGWVGRGMVTSPLGLRTWTARFASIASGGSSSSAVWSPTDGGAGSGAAAGASDNSAPHSGLRSPSARPAAAPTVAGSAAAGPVAAAVSGAMPVAGASVAVASGAGVSGASGAGVSGAGVSGAMASVAAGPVATASVVGAVVDGDGWVGSARPGYSIIGAARESSRLTDGRSGVGSSGAARPASPSAPETAAASGTGVEVARPGGVLTGAGDGYPKGSAAEPGRPSLNGPSPGGPAV